MSSGVIGDWEETKRLLKPPETAKGGKTWLRHSVKAQAGQIDLMLLAGKFSIGEMVEELRRQGMFDTGMTDDQCIRRVRNHLEHLRQGDWRNKSSGMKPHNLKLIEVNGKWSFDVF